MTARTSTPALRWRRIALWLAAAALLAYLFTASALWAYYKYSRNISEAQWIDIAICTRFGRVQQAVGAHHLALAREHWKNGEFAKGLFLARAATAKRPHDPEARLFLASCWREVGRADYAIRGLEDGLAHDTDALPLSRALIALYLQTGRHRDALTLIRVKLPALGRQPAADQQVFFQHAEVQCLFETEGAQPAAALAEHCEALGQLPAAAPLLARIALALHQPDAALSRLRDAVGREPTNPAIHDALVDLAMQTGRHEEARAAAERFVGAFPALPAAELRLLEIHGTRAQEARTPWLLSCMRYLARFRQQPAALEQLADLAARHGWSDLAFLLYQDAVATGGRDRAFASFYIGSLLASRDFPRADAVWRDLTAQKSAPADSAPALAAMVASGAGREGEALEQIERLRRSTSDDAGRRDRLARLFRGFGFAPLAERLLAGER